MARVPSASDDRQVGEGLPQLSGQPPDQDRIVHRQDDRSRLERTYPIEKLRVPYVSEDDVVTLLPCGRDRVDIRIDRQIIFPMGLEHLRNEASDAAEAEDDDLADRSRL